MLLRASPRGRLGLGGLSVPTEVVLLCGKPTTMTAPTYWSRVKIAPVALGEWDLPKATERVI
jgi:hypothetical protein